MSLSLYKPNSKNTGCAFNFKIGANKNKEPVVYVTAIQQYSWDDSKKLANFSGNSNDEEKKINLKFTEFEIGGIMSAFKHRNEFSSYHSYDQSKTAIKFVPWDKKTKIKNGDKEEWVTLPAFGITFTRNGNQSFRIPVEAGEVENLLEFFRYFLLLLNEHRYEESLKNLEKYRAKREQKQESKKESSDSKDAPF